MSAKLLMILQVERRGEESFEFDVSKLTWILRSDTPTWKINASVCRLLFLTVDCYVHVTADGTGLQLVFTN